MVVSSLIRTLSLCVLFFASFAHAGDTLRVLVRADDEPLTELRPGLIYEKFGRPVVELELRAEQVDDHALRRRARRTGTDRLPIPREYWGPLQWILDHRRPRMSVPDGFGGYRNLQVRYLLVVLSGDLSEVVGIDGAFYGDPDGFEARGNAPELVGNPRVVDLLEAAPPWAAHTLLLSALPIYFEDRRLVAPEIRADEIWRLGHEAKFQAIVPRMGRTELFVTDVSLRKADLRGAKIRWRFPVAAPCVRVFSDWKRRPLIRAFGS